MPKYLIVTLIEHGDDLSLAAMRKELEMNVDELEEDDVVSYEFVVFKGDDAEDGWARLPVEVNFTGTDDGKLSDG